MKVVINFHAEKDLEAAESFYNSKREGLGLEFLLEFFDSVDEIKENPETWKMSYNNTRRYLMNCFPFQIVYYIHNSKIEIIAVGHFKRKPNYRTR